MPSLIAPCDACSLSEIRGRFTAQRAAFRAKAPDYEYRLHALRSLERALVQHQESFIEAISRDFGGRAAEETLMLEVFPALNEIRYAARHLKSWMQSRRAGVSWQFWPGRAKVLHLPLGVVGILSAWNCPVFLSFAPLAGALAAGNHVMLKPSDLAPATATLIRSVLADIYAPEYVSVVLGGGDTASEFVSLPFDHLLFTGSTRVGKLVMKAASENLTPVTLELGGKSPALIHRGYKPLQTAAARILAGKLYNCGQTCVAPDYLLLPHECERDFVESARRITSSMYPTYVANPDYTRIINEGHYSRLSRLVENARQLGAEIIQINPAEDDCNENNRVFPLTLVLGVREDMLIMQEEIFGPILPVVLYRELNDAITYINERPHALALYYFDDNARRIQTVLEKTIVGGVTVNDCMMHVGQPSLPFGGIGASGLGHYHGFYGFERFSRKTGVFQQGRRSPLSFLRPPYSQRTRQILKFLIG